MTTHRAPFSAALAAGVLLALRTAACAQEIWLSADEVQALPVSGPAWEHIKGAADSVIGPPNLSDQDQDHNVLILAKALVYARTGESGYRIEVIRNCLAAIGTEQGGTTLALGRELAAYVIAADLIGFRGEPFTAWLRQCRRTALDGQTLIQTHERRPNNWGTHAGASRLAVALYLDDRQEIERAAQVFRGWVGDRTAYDGFEFGALAWQADPIRPVAVNPRGSVRDGFVLDGALPDEMRRGGRFQDPPVRTGYPWGALQGAIVQAELLHRAGYPAYEWQDRAILRAVEFLYGIDWPPAGDDEWLAWIINKRYGKDFPTNVAARPGKNMGWTNWTHAAR
jgi:hypothetical protein